MAKTWESTIESGQPEALEMLLYETDDKLDTVFADTELVDELAKSFYAMDNYVAEVGFMAEALFANPASVTVMANRVTALRELLLRDSTRNRLFSTRGASRAVAESVTAMDYIANALEYGSSIQSEWMSDLVGTKESREEFIGHNPAFTELTGNSEAMEAIAADVVIMQSLIPEDPAALDTFFAAPHSVGDGLSTHNERLGGTPVEIHDTLANVYADPDSVSALIASIDKTLDLIQSSPDVGLAELYDSVVATDVVTSDVPATEFFLLQPDIRTRTLSAPKMTDSLWTKATSSIVWDQFVSSYPATQNGVGIEGAFDVVTGRQSADSTALQISWTSDADADSFAGLGMNINADLANTLSVSTNVDASASGHLAVELDGNRALEVLDTNHATGWDGYDIDISTYTGETTLSFGVVQKTTTSLVNGTFRFGDFTLQ